MENEIYRYIVINGQVNMKYKISNFGRIVNVEKSNKIIKQSRTKYYYVCGIDGHIYNVHKLVINTFIGTNPNPEKNVCDHINGNSFDNRLVNLRWCTYRENGANKKVKDDRGMKGVFYHPKRNNYTAKIFTQGRCYYLGTFQDCRSAKVAYNEKAVELFGEFAVLNDV